MKHPRFEATGTGSKARNAPGFRKVSLPQGRELKENLEAFLPDESSLTSLLGLHEPAPVEDILRAALLDPVGKMTSNPGKKIRGRLVSLGYRLFSDGSPRSVIAARHCRVSAEVIEYLHAASLVVDDIEDGSRMRRGRPALHIRYGMPVALNAGNWLYFWPFELLKKLELPGEKMRLIYEHCHRTLLKAHFGQAMDLGTRVDTLPQNHVRGVCLASMQLKTGALMGLALVLGGVIAEMPPPVIRLLEKFGSNFGVVLQMFDDLGNLSSYGEPSKRYEDLVLCRPSWAWACAASHFTAAEYRNFMTAVGKLPDAKELESWLAKNALVELGRSAAKRRMESAIRTLEEGLETEGVSWSRHALNEVRAVGEEIAVAYG